MTVEHEIPLSQITRDTRDLSGRIYDSTFRPENFRFVLLGFMVLQVLLPALWPLWLLVLLILWALHSDYQFTMPMRLPVDQKCLDKSDYDNVTMEDSFFGLWKTKRQFRRYRKAAGILYLGATRSRKHAEQSREMWITNSDARTHMMVLGTTGSGKSELLKAISYNALCWGSGFCFADGKADSSLAFSLWSMARKMGREDDFLVLNYLTGASGSVETGEKSPLAQSNSMNPFAEGTPDFLLQLLTSMLPAAGGDGAQWQKKAINMMSALLFVLCHKRDQGEIRLSINTIRHYLALNNMVQLYIEGMEGHLPELVFLPLKNYFDTGLPGFKSDLAYKIEEWPQETYNQHGYLSGQFAPILSMMIDSYGFIFRDSFPEIDMQDVLLNNRILVVLIPSLEKSGQETESLGKLYIAAIKLMMAKNLGHTLEGTGKEILDTKTTKFPYPNIIISDELSYYFAEGIAVMFAQARSLGFMMIAAAQDIQGFSRGVNKEEAASMIANTKIKWTLALEDPNETYDLIRKAGGESYRSILSGHEYTPNLLSAGYTTQKQINIQRTDRIHLDELKKLNPGEGMAIFKNSVIQNNAFYIEEGSQRTEALPVKINRFVQVKPPQIENLPESAEVIDGRDDVSTKFILSCFRRNERPHFPEIKDPILDSVLCTAHHLSKLDSMQYTAMEKGIILFESAREAMNKAKRNGLQAPYHEPDYSAETEEELLLEEDEDEWA